jgi:hypothetical protein
MRDRGHVADRRDREADRLERAKGALAARARTLHFDLERANAVLGGLLARVLGGDLRGVGRRLARPLKPIIPAEDQAIALPCASVIVIMVLLKLAFT